MIAMAISERKTTRRQFVSRSALLTGGVGLGLNCTNVSAAVASGTEDTFSAYQARRREALWGLLGDLPWQHEPAPPRLVRTEEHDTYTIERLVLDLNGIEPVPALLLIPKQLRHPAPGLLFIHWHAGMYGLGKEQLLKGTSVQPAYASVLAEMGIVTLAIDSWCFGERREAVAAVEERIRRVCHRRRAMDGRARAAGGRRCRVSSRPLPGSTAVKVSGSPSAPPSA